MTKSHLIARRAAAVLLPLAAAAGLIAAKAPKVVEPQGDVAHGQALFAQCKACHSVEPGKNMIGPSLDGIVGRKAAAATGYTYSTAMKASGLTWTPKALSEYLTAPMKKVPGTKMGFAGMAKEDDRTDIIAYLAKN